MSLGNLTLNSGTGGDNLPIYSDGTRDYVVGLVGFLASVATPSVVQNVDATHGLPVHQQTGATWAVSLASVPSHAVTNAGTFVVQVDGAALTNLAGIDGKIPSLGQALAAASVPVVLTAAQITTLTPPAAITGYATESTLSTLNGKVTVCNTGAVTISAALPAGTNAIGKLAANSGVTIGAVELAASQTLATVTTVGAVTAITNALPAGENHLGEVGAKSDLISVTLSLDTNIYASGDVLAEAQAVANAVRVSGGTGALQSLVLTDEDDQGAAMTLYLFDSSVTMGTENGAPSLSDADSRKLLGIIPVATGDYKDLGGVKVAMPSFAPFLVKPASGRDLYVAAVNGSGTPTYTASGVRLRFGILQD